jgi:transposase
MPKKFPSEFKRDVVAIARRGTIPTPEVAANFALSESTFQHRDGRGVIVDRE